MKKIGKLVHMGHPSWGGTIKVSKAHFELMVSKDPSFFRSDKAIVPKPESKIEDASNNITTEGTTTAADPQEGN